MMLWIGGYIAVDPQPKVDLLRSIGEEKLSHAYEAGPIAADISCLPMTLAMTRSLIHDTQVGIPQDRRLGLSPVFVFWHSSGVTSQRC